MNKPLSWKILIPLGIILFIFGGGVYGDIGIIGLICFISGVLSLIFPKQLEKFTIIKSHGNTLSIIVLFVVFVLAIIYIWWKLYS
jgi:membrane-bound ClpP family serine protease